MGPVLHPYNLASWPSEVVHSQLKAAKPHLHLWCSLFAYGLNRAPYDTDTTHCDGWDPILVFEACALRACVKRRLRCAEATATAVTPVATVTALRQY